MMADKVQYKNNQEYRKCIRDFFQMKESISALDIDDETKDEQNYDDTSSTKMLNHVYSITKENTHFQELYSYAAATMFSTDPEIGLAVLFSYDYFVLFHPLLCSFHQAWKMPVYYDLDIYEIEPTCNTNLEKNPYFIALKKKLC
jgi:hypothetical protein